MWLCSGDAGRDALCCWPCPHRASGPSESFPPIPPAAHSQPPRLAGPPELRVGPAGQRCPPAGPPHPRRECAREALIAGTSAHPPLLAPAVPARMRSGRGGRCSGRSEGRACVARTRRTQGRRRCRRTPARGRGSRAAGCSWGRCHAWRNETAGLFCPTVRSLSKWRGPLRGRRL